MDNMEIIEAIRSGDKEAIKNVYKDHAKDVYNFAKSITGEHESAMAATKKTFVNLFTSIQKGENPTNIRLTALKMAYDEACAIALPSTENIDSPFDKKEEAPAQEEAEGTIATAGVVGDGIIDTKEEMDEVMDEANTDEPIVDETEDVPAAEEEGTKYAKFDAQDEDKLSNTQVFSIKEAMDGEGEVEMSDEEYDDEYDDDDDYDDEDDDYEPVPRSKVATIIIIVINVLLVILLVWLLYGLLVSFGVISDIAHIGFTYTFFNEHIYPIF